MTWHSPVLSPLSPCPPYSLKTSLSLPLIFQPTFSPAFPSFWAFYPATLLLSLPPSLPLLRVSLSTSAVHHSVRPPLPRMLHASPPMAFQGKFNMVCLVFPRIPFGCLLSLPPDTKTNKGRPAKSSKHHWCWPHCLVFTFSAVFRWNEMVGQQFLCTYLLWNLK